MTLGHILMNIIIQDIVALLKEQIINSFYFVRILFSQFLLTEGVVMVLKELIFNSYY